MYVDPGLGSIMIQAIIGFVIAIPVFLGLYWRKVKSWFSRKRDKDDITGNEIKSRME